MVGSILHQLEELDALDSGFYTEDEEEQDEETELTLCSSCIRSLPREFEENLQDVHQGLVHVNYRVRSRKRKLSRQSNMSDMLSEREKELSKKRKEEEGMRKELEEIKEKLNNNYVLVAQLSSENLRILGENGRLEKRLEELGREKSEMMLKLEDEILRLNSSLADKEIEVESMRMKVDELEEARRELRTLEDTVSHLKAEIENQEGDYRRHQHHLGMEKSSPETSSSFDFFPPEVSLLGTSLKSDSMRPRAFSSCTRNLNIGKDKLADVSSPDLGVDVESSDPFSSLERGPKVGSLVFDQLINENKKLRGERSLLEQKLVKSKSALQDTLSRLSRANLQKQDQVASPVVGRRPPSRLFSDRGRNRSPTTSSPPLSPLPSPALSSRKWKVGAQLAESAGFLFPESRTSSRNQTSGEQSGFKVKKSKSVNR